ncbi:MAG: GDP-mannose 4,6-dehydratase [Methylophilus sp.]|jgi:nucleoside-diphosphate-sugar epimerase
MKKKALITGVNGFTGRYVAAQLAALDFEVIGLVHNAPEQAIHGVSRVLACDLLDLNQLKSITSETQPDVVYHLAAISFVAHGDISSIYNTNIIGTRNLLQALVDSEIKPESVLVASSANIYGNSESEYIDESVCANPANDYAVSKLATEYVAKLFMDKLPIIITRPFNYTGAGQSEKFLLPKIVSHFKSKAPFIELGNLDVSRDFSDVRMVADAYIKLTNTPSAIGKTINICSGEVYTLGQVIEMSAKLSDHSLEVRVNPNFVRQNEVKILRGNRSLLDSLIGTQDGYSLKETLSWMLSA